MLEEDNVFKISMPLISDLELNEIDNNMDTIINQFIKQLVKNKDLAIAQHIIQKQQEEIELLKDQQQYVIDEYGETIEKKDKIIDEMAKDKYENISILEMAKIGQELQYDPAKMFNGITDEEAINIIKQYFESKV